MPPITRAALERFEEKFTKGDPSECWLWRASKTSFGYGRFSFTHYHTKRAHRISWEFYRGPIPNGIHVLHKCDVRDCVNPDHLFLGTNQDNVNDRETKGRGNQRKGEKHHNTKLTEDQVYEIRASNERTDALAKQYGVTPHTIWQIRMRRRWKSLEEKAQ